MKNNLLWIQYTPGAAGKIILMCCTTSDAVGNWINDPLPDPVAFTTKHFCNPDSSKHILSEITTPYQIGWYTRDQLFTRGDNLTPLQVNKHLLEDPLASDHLKKGLLIINCYNKTYVPSWCEKLITIYNDNDSVDWLLNRRKHLFYEWQKDKVQLLKYMSDRSPINKNRQRLYPAIQYEYTYTDANKFVYQDFKKENVQKGNGFNIALSDILYKSSNYICSQLNEYLPKPVNTEWCKLAIDTWKERWV